LLGNLAWLAVAGTLGWPGLQPARAESPTTDIFDLSRAGDAAGVEQALASGTDVDVRDALGQTPIVVAALAGQNSVAQVLLSHGADVMARTDKGMTPLHAAAFSGDLEIVKLLLASGAAINDQDNFAHITALHAAAEENHTAVVEALIKTPGADTALVDVKGFSASTLAGWKQNWDVVEIMVSNGDTCQPEAIAGPWVFKKCAELAAAAKSSQSN
jgi:ankyrin repeat protein